VDTSKLTILDYAAVHDAGTVVNPKSLNGQIIGGTIQGLGTALYEARPDTGRGSADYGRTRSDASCSAVGSGTVAQFTFKLDSTLRFAATSACVTFWSSTCSTALPSYE
jgi:hypothetical protein